MKLSITRRSLVLALAVITLGLIVSPLQAEVGDPEWDHSQHGEDWGSIEDADGNFPYATCDAGQSQSPININKVKRVRLDEIQFNYHPTELTIVNNSHTIEVEYESEPASTITVGGETYTLRQFHFHTKSEHTRNGRHTPVEMHLVHENDAGELAVVGVQIKRSHRTNQAFEPIWDRLPEEEGPAETFEGVFINAQDLLPKARIVGDDDDDDDDDHRADYADIATQDAQTFDDDDDDDDDDKRRLHRPYYTYDGSLTTPACNEGVTWYLLKDFNTMSRAQINELRAIESTHNNYRLTHPLNDRTVHLYELHRDNDDDGDDGDED